MPDWMIVPATPEHIPHLAANMRGSDRREVWASHRHTPQEALEASLACSDLAWTCCVQSVPAFMWGVARQGAMTSFTGVPWLLGTPRMYAVRRDFLRHCLVYVNAMQEAFPLLENYVHAENQASVRWLEWCGFTVEREIPELINDEDFYRFWRV